MSTDHCSSCPHITLRLCFPMIFLVLNPNESWCKVSEVSALEVVGFHRKLMRRFAIIRFRLLVFLHLLSKVKLIETTLSKYQCFSLINSPVFCASLADSLHLPFNLICNTCFCLISLHFNKFRLKLKQTFNFVVYVHFS